MAELQNEIFTDAMATGIVNLEKRIQLITSACEQIIQKDWKKFYEDTMQIRLHNFNWFYQKRPTFLSPIYDDLEGYLDRI